MSDANDIYRGKTVLVTGDTGFKGSWLAIWLLHLGARVIGFSLPPRTQRDNYNVCGLKDKFTHIDGDIRNYEAVREALGRHRPDIVFHLAAQALVLDAYADPLGTFQTNVMGTVNVLEAVRHTPSVKAVLVITSDKCYDNREWVYGYRENDPLGGKDPYSGSKGACEIAAASYDHSFFSAAGTANIATVRAGNVLGGGDWCANRIMPDCIRALQEDRPIVMRNPDSVRPWQHVLEPLSGYLKLGSRLLTEGKTYSGPWNFGPRNKDLIPVSQLVAETIRHWGCGKCVVDRPSGAPGEARMLNLDVSKAVNLLGWRPVLDFEETIRLTVEEYKVDGMTADDIYAGRVGHIKKYEQSGKKRQR
jgi:CDP-glucose 4,6-dehydratase